MSPGKATIVVLLGAAFLIGAGWVLDKAYSDREQAD
jgi:hypothetical protein